METLLSIITPSFNSFENLLNLYNKLSIIKTKNFIWYIIDGNSTDGTKPFFEKKFDSWIIFVSENDNGIYDAINKGLKLINTDYYLVVGSDDIPDLNEILSVLTQIIADKPHLIMGSVNFGKNELKKPSINVKKLENSFMSFHSVGTVIRKDLHKQLGYYSTTLFLASDELFFQKVIRTNDFKFYVSNSIFGYYSNNGRSANLKYLATLEMLYVKGNFFKLKFWDLIKILLKLNWYKFKK